MPRHDDSQSIEKFIEEFESIAAAELSRHQLKQSFDGRLRVDLDRVFVSRSEGDRIVEKLQTLDPDQLLRAR